MTIGLTLGACLFLIAAWLGERNALYIPVLVLVAAAIANLEFG